MHGHRQTSRGRSIEAHSPPRRNHARHGSSGVVVITGDDAAAVAKATAALTVLHHYRLDDDDSPDQTLLDAEQELTSHLDEGSIAGRRRSASPHPSRHRSVSMTSGSRSRQVSAQGSSIPAAAAANYAQQREEPEAREEMPPPVSLVGRSWTKDDWRRLEAIEQAEQRTCELQGQPEPSTEDVVRVFLVSEGITRRQCREHWAWYALRC
jgi:hypothetical protein